MREYTNPLQDIPNVQETFAEAQELVNSLPPDIQNRVRAALMNTFRLGWNMQNFYWSRNMSSSLADKKSTVSEQLSEKYGDDILKLKKGFLDMLENAPES